MSTYLLRNSENDLKVFVSDVTVHWTEVRFFNSLDTKCCFTHFNESED